MRPETAESARPGSPSPRERRVRRVLHVTNMFPTPARPGFGIIVQRIVEALRAAGVENRVEAISGDRGNADYLLGRRRVATAVRAFRPDVVHVHFGYTAIATGGGVPRVVSFYGDDLNGESTGEGRTTLKSRLGVALSRLAARVCERSIAVSETLRSRLPAGDVRDRCTVIRDAVDTRLFHPGDRAAARRRLGVREGSQLVLFPHALAQRTKRVDLARAAVERLAARGEPAELWIVNGRAPDEMPDVYRAADALIVTSDLEGGPSCVKEALACGLPVVSVPVGDTSVLEEARAICEIAPRDPEALATALTRAIARGAGDRRSHLPAELALPRAIERIRDVYEAAWLARQQASSSAR
jgi:teichuronic acid biosynthesis glycosyltransferase TuaC